MAITSENIGGNSGGTNSGYVIELILINAKDIISITDPAYDGDPEKPFTVINGNVAINVDAKVFKMKFRTKSCTWSESASKGIHGLVYNSTFSFDFPKNNPALAAFLNKYRFATWVAIWCDANGQCYITGEPNFGLQMLTSRRIGSGSNTTGVSFSCSSWHQSWFLESINLDLLSQSTFNEEFTQEFDVGY